MDGGLRPGPDSFKGEIYNNFRGISNTNRSFLVTVQLLQLGRTVPSPENLDVLRKPKPGPLSSFWSCEPVVMSCLPVSLVLIQLRGPWLS